MKHFVVHVGLRKTATTSIQFVLSAGASILADKAHALPRDTHFETWRTHVYRYMLATPEQAGSHKKAMLDGIEAEAKAVLPWLEALPEDTVIISDENLFGARVYAHGETIFDWAEEVLPIVERAWSGHKITFVLYVRDQEKWLRSCHNQEVKNNRAPLTYTEWRQRIPEYFDLQRNARHLAENLNSDMQIVALEDELAEGARVGKALLEIAGISKEDIARLPHPKVLNQSLPPAALDFMIAVNKLPISDASKPAIGELSSALRHLFVK